MKEMNIESIIRLWLLIKHKRSRNSEECSEKVTRVFGDTFCSFATVIEVVVVVVVECISMWLTFLK